MVKSYSHIKIIGLTGSIATGKTTICSMFKALNIPVFEADSIVHKALKTNNIIEKVQKEFPSVIIAGEVNREKLSEIVFSDVALLEKLEKILHPEVAKERDNFIHLEQEKNTSIVVLDIPLLFETGDEKICDAVVVASVSKEIQIQRLLDRGMDIEKINFLQNRQLSDEIKRKKADFIVETGGTLADTEKQVRDFLQSFL